MIRELEEVLMREREKRELQKIPEEFYGRVGEYLENLRKNNSKITKFVEREVEELFQLRCKKILEGERENIAEEEYKVLREILKFQKSVKKVFEAMLFGEKKVKVKILKDVPEIIGPDMKAYGPYKKGEVIDLAKNIAKFIKRHGLGEIQGEANENAKKS